MLTKWYEALSLAGWNWTGAVVYTIQGGRSCAGTTVLSPNLRYFVAILIFVAVYTLFGRLCFFGSRTVFLGQEVYHYMAYIAYLTKWICNYAQKRRICRENSKCTPDENFLGHFCTRRKAATLKICLGFSSENQILLHFCKREHYAETNRWHVCTFHYRISVALL